MATQPLLELASLNRVSKDGTKLLCDVSLSIHTGERIALLGKSGSGKSLLLRSLAALDPVGDCLRCRGQRVPPPNIPRFRSEIIYLHQTPALPAGTVLAALKEPFQWVANSSLSFERDKSIEMLERLHWSASFLDKKTTDLSGGEAGLIAIIRALQLRPMMLLLDEPTAAMDQETTLAVEALINDWAGDDRRTYIWVTHDAEQASRIADRTIQILDGSIVR